MWSKCVIVLLLVAFESRLISGQFFRKDYVYVNDEKSFYKIHTSAKTWAQAKVRCVLEGASLFFPETHKEAIAVTSLWNVKSPEVDDMYIGIAKWNVPEFYETVDGRKMSEGYQNWAYGEPTRSCSNDSCVLLQRDGTFKDDECNSKHAFVCKKTLSSVQWNSECNLPDPSYKYNKTLNRCYKFHLYPKTWTEAFVICDAEQSYLAIINSVDEDKHLINITAAAPKDNIGGNYLRGAVHLGFHNRSGTWETIKGVPLDQSGFGGGWGYTQPDGGGTELCGSMFYTGELNDIGCWQRMFFICEHELDSPSKYVKNKYRSSQSVV